MILCFTPNPALDESYVVPELTLDSSHRVTEPTVQAGGKGLNVARVLHSQRIPVLAVSAVGGASGDEFLADLEQSGIPSLSIQVTAQTRRSMAFYDPQANTTTVFNQQGFALDHRQWNKVSEQFTASLARAKAVVIAGSWPPASAPDRLVELILGAKNSGCWVLVDVSGPMLLDAARQGAVLKPNEHELREATGCKSITAGARHLLQLGASEVFVSAGERGMYHYDAQQASIAHAVLPEVLSGNPTGAGDSAVAALACSYVEQREREFTLRRAVAWSASTVLMPTAGALAPNHPKLFDEVLYQLLDEDAEI